MSSASPTASPALERAHVAVGVAHDAVAAREHLRRDRGARARCARAAAWRARSRWRGSEARGEVLARGGPVSRRARARSRHARRSAARACARRSRSRAMRSAGVSRRRARRVEALRAHVSTACGAGRAPAGGAGAATASASASRSGLAAAAAAVGVGRAQVGDEVGDREVGLVAHAAHDGDRGGGDRARHHLLVEGPQVLEAAAAAADDQHVALARARWPRSIARAICAAGAFALHLGRVEDHRHHRRAPRERGEHVAQRRGRGRGDDADGAREGGQRALARRVEEALGVRASPSASRRPRAARPGPPCASPRPPAGSCRAARRASRARAPRPACRSRAGSRGTGRDPGTSRNRSTPRRP